MKYLILLFLIFFSIQSFAIEEIIRNYRSPRTMGMGGVVTTTGDYGDALFANPARHSETEFAKFSLIDINLEANTNLINNAQNVSNIKGGSGGNTISKAADLIGQNQHFRMDYLLGYYNPNFIAQTGFAFGLLVDAQTNMTIHSTTDLDSQLVAQVGPNVGISHRFLDDTLSLGINLHLLYRAANDDTISVLDFLSGSKGVKLKDLASEGAGADADIGAFYFIPWDIEFMKLSFGASLNNVLKTHYTNYRPEYIKGLGKNPPASARLFHAGTRLDFIDFYMLKESILAFELQDIGDTGKQYSLFKRIHLGGETKIYKILIVRAGINQGYLCGGLGLNLPILKIDVATYGEELSANVGGVEDRRYILRLAVEF